MSASNPAASKKRRGLIPGQLRLPTGNRFDILFIGIAGLLVLAFCLYLAWVWKSNHPSIRFSPEDVVYGETLQARQEMGPPSTRQNIVATDSVKNRPPQIHVSENYFDFGVISPDQIVTRTFLIANQGSAPLVILRAYTTCGCTTADFTASEIPPGKVALMTLRFDAGYHNMVGYTVRRGVLIETNDPVKPLEEIWIQATIR